MSVAPHLRFWVAFDYAIHKVKPGVVQRVCRADEAWHAVIAARLGDAATEVWIEFIYYPHKPTP